MSQSPSQFDRTQTRNKEWWRQQSHFWAPFKDETSNWKSKRAGKYGTKKRKERQEEPLGTMSYQTSSKLSRSFWRLIGARKLLCFSAQSEGIVPPTIRCIALCVLQLFGFSVPSIILEDLLGNTCLLARVQKVMVCDSWLVDFDPFYFFGVSRLIALRSSCFGQ